MFACADVTIFVDRRGIKMINGGPIIVEKHVQQLQNIYLKVAFKLQFIYIYSPSSPMFLMFLPILGQYSIPILLEKVRKPMIFWRFQGL